jgi:glycosyltransferase involved in cell wall biosynthesis
LILAAGGQRTIESLLAAGVSREKIFETLDCGLRDEFFTSAASSEPRPVGRFIHFGRLVFHKGTSLAIEALALTGPGVTLDIVGKGPELEHCKSLTSRLNVGERVRFLDWYQSRKELIASLRNYQGMVLPSMEDANGMVVQEAMAVGLVPVCLDWGGPQLLIEHDVSGYLVRPETPRQVVQDIASFLNRLHDEPLLANRMSLNAQARAVQWAWSHTVREWHDQYNSLLANEARSERA